MTTNTNGMGETGAAVLGANLTAGGADSGAVSGGGAGMGGTEVLGAGVVDVLPFTGISTLPLALAGLIAAAAGGVATWLGRDAKHAVDQP